MRSEASRHGITLRSELSTSLPLLMADRVQIQQVLVNLIVNGIDATKSVDSPRELYLSSQLTDAEVVVSVSDTGPGLSSNDADHIFKAFFTTKDHGTGMGLSISRSIVESHGGKLWAKSAEGRGATFQFSLPVGTRVEAPV